MASVATVRHFCRNNHCQRDWNEANVSILQGSVMYWSQFVLYIKLLVFRPLHSTNIQLLDVLFNDVYVALCCFITVVDL